MSDNSSKAPGGSRLDGRDHRPLGRGRSRISAAPAAIEERSEQEGVSARRMSPLGQVRIAVKLRVDSPPVPQRLPARLSLRASEMPGRFACVASNPLHAVTGCFFGRTSKQLGHSRRIVGALRRGRPLSVARQETRGRGAAAPRQRGFSGGGDRVSLHLGAGRIKSTDPQSNSRRLGGTRASQS